MFSCCSSWDPPQRLGLSAAQVESESPAETSEPEESEGPALVVYRGGTACCKGLAQADLLACALASS